MSEKKAREAVKSLEDEGVLETKLEGVPPKKYFYFTEELNNFIEKVYSLKTDDDLKKLGNTGRVNPSNLGRVKCSDSGRVSIYIQPKKTQPKEEEDSLYLSSVSGRNGTPKPNLFSSPNSEVLKKAPTLNCSNSELAQIKPPSKQDDDDFMAFFDASPVQSRFQSALETWHQKRVKGRLPPIDKILEALEEQKLYRYTDPKYIPSPAKWLEEEEWRYVIDAKTKARVNKILHEKRLDELEDMYRGDATNEEIEAFARKYNLRPDVFPPINNEEGKNELE